MTTDPRNADIRYNPDAQEELSVQSDIVTRSYLHSDKPRKMKPRTKMLFGLAAAGVLGWGGYEEYTSSSLLQATIIPKMAKGEIGASLVKTTPPAVGNRDIELCYAMIPKLRKLFTEEDGDIVTDQKEWLQHHIGPYKLPPVFHRPTQSGTHIVDNNGEDMYVAITPHDIYPKIENIPTQLALGLALVEDKKIIDPDKPDTFNVALNIPRVGKAALESAEKKLGKRSNSSGGSTMSMQITKDEITPEGISNTVLDKFDQLAVSSLYVYENGANTVQSSQREFTKYVNGVRFTSHPKVGEVKGFKSGMAIWFGRTDYDEKIKNGIVDEESATIYREWMTLVMAVQWPDVVLRTRTGFKNSQERLESFLPLLVKKNIISQAEADMVKAVQIDYSKVGKNPALPPAIPRDKSVDTLRLALLKKMRLDPVDGFYVLNRCHLTVDSPLDKGVNEAVNAELRKFNDVKYAQANGLTGEKKLRPESVPRAIYAVTLNEVMPDGRVFTRVSTDTYNGPLDLTRGKQNNGSYNKKVMLATHLQLSVSALHEKYSGKSVEELQAVAVHPKDAITRWALDYMMDPEKDQSKDALLRAATKRVYSAAPKTFFTGGGLLSPRNFEPAKENGKSFTVEEALWRSNNLAWFKITDDTEENIKWEVLGIDHRIFDDNQTDPAVLALRDKYLKEFADYEGSVFFSRAWVRMQTLKKELTEKAGSFYDTVSLKSQEELVAIRDNEKDEVFKWIASYMISMKPYQVDEQTQKFEFKLMKHQEETEFKKAVLQKAVRHFHHGQIASMLADRTTRSTTPLAVLFLSQYPESDFKRFEDFIRKECHKNCNIKDKELQALYELHKPFKQIDIVADLIAKTDGNTQAAINIHRAFYPQDTYQQTRQALAGYKPEIDSFKSFEKEFEQAPAPASLEESKAVLAAMTDVNSPQQPEQLAAILGRIQPSATLAEMLEFITKFCPDCRKNDGFKTKDQHLALYNRYITTPYSSGSYLYRFDLNDRGYLVSRGVQGSRAINPMALQAAYYLTHYPTMTLDQSLKATEEDRQVIYKWQFKSSNKKTQDKNIGIMLDHHAWREIEKFWKNMGYPFKLVPSLASVIGVSGSNTEFMSTFDATLLNNGMSVNTTRITGLHFGKGTPHETHVKPGQPPTRRIMDPEVAKIVLETARGVVEHGTGRRLLGTFKLSNGQILDATGKTGTNGETETLGIQGGYWGGTIGPRFSIAFAVYLENATSADKFTSAVAIQGLQLLASKLQPVFDRSYGITPSLSGQIAQDKPALTFADYKVLKDTERAAKLEALRNPQTGAMSLTGDKDIQSLFMLSASPDTLLTEKKYDLSATGLKSVCLLPCVRPE